MVLGSNTSAHIFDTTFTTNGPLYSAANGVVTSGAAGTAGQLYQSAGAVVAPGYTTATYPATAGTAGKVLISDGTNIVSSTPTFPNASATSGKFIRSDGTNWIASTPTLPTTAGTSGKVLQSNGTNFVETTATYPGTATVAGTILRADGTNFVATTSTYPNTNAVSTLLYASSANVMAALATANSGVLSTSATGVPSIDTTNFAVLTTGLQLKGNNTNTASPAGFLGELISSNILTGSAVSLVNGTSKTVTSISVTAGNWMITGFVVVNTGTTQVHGASGISTTTDTLPTLFNIGVAANSGVINKGGFPCPNVFVSLSGTTTYYLIAQSGFTLGSSTAYGNITAIRIG